MQKLAMKQAVDENFENFRDHLAQLVAINSENGPEQPGKPMGEGAYEALCTALDIARALGFCTVLDEAGYYGYAEVGEGEEMLGVLGHVDIVPAGDETLWHSAPFTLSERDGVWYGRGVQDDKGPMLAAMYGLYLFLKGGGVLTKRVRFIFCTDEEIGWRCVHRYVQCEELPSLGFTPDSSFPLIYAEKGVLQYRLTTREPSCVPLVGGTAVNAVPEEANAPYTEALAEAMRALGHPFEKQNDTLCAKGKAVHAKDAPQGENAAVHLCAALYKCGESGALLRFIAEKAADATGEALFGKVEDVETGHLTLNVGTIRFANGRQQADIDIRFPVSYTREQVAEQLQKTCADYDVLAEEQNYLKPLHIEKDTALVKLLLQAYHEASGDTQAEPRTSGGATFARSMDNILAFGASLPGAPSTEHRPNECLSVRNFKTAIEIYARAFELLAGQSEA